MFTRWYEENYVNDQEPSNVGKCFLTSSNAFPENGSSTNVSRLYPSNPSLDEEIRRLFPVLANNGGDEEFDVDSVMEEFKNNGRDSEYCPEFDNVVTSPVVDVNKNVLSYNVSLPRRPPGLFDGGSYSETTFEEPLRLSSGIFTQRLPKAKKFKKPLESECVFCRNNNELEAVYKSHYCKDQFGRVVCPILREYKCPICGVCGDHAHTLKYCPARKQNQLSVMQSSRRSYDYKAIAPPAVIAVDQNNNIM